jgi:hypothetical protein
MGAPLQENGIITGEKAKRVKREERITHLCL